MTARFSSLFQRQLAELADVLGRIDSDEVTRAVDAIAAAPKVFLIGRGRNGLALGGFGNRLMQLGKPVEIIGDLLTGPVRKDDLLVVASASGTSAALLDATRIARSTGATVLALTSGRNTPLSERSDMTVEIAGKLADDSSSHQPLGTLFEQSLALVCDAMVVDLMSRLGATVDDMRARHATIE